MRSTFKRFPLLALAATATLAACSTSPTGENASAAARSPDSATPLSVPMTSGAATAELVAPAALRNLKCNGAAGGRRYACYTVTAQLTATGTPTNVLSYPTYYPATPGSYRNTGVVVTNYPGFPGYKVWNVTGHANGIGTPGNIYYLLMPPSLPGRGGMFPAELHIVFAGGTQGWWQVISTCVVS
ncbi:MAG: hypothetical protein SGJ01_01420 [Gemmatimonadota bacterium]|nr:hypothetical protein [Gemmatimonadota bacterium]